MKTFPYLATGYQAVDIRFDHGGLPCAGQTRNENIVAVVFHGEAELYSADGPVLTYELAQWSQIFCALEIKNCGVALPAQLSHGNFKLFHVHTRNSLRVL